MESESRFSIVFVCSGNICRSPMAALMAEQILAGRCVLVESAGTLGIEGYPATEYAMKAVAELDLDLSGHISTGLTTSCVSAADAIAVMAPRHEQEVLKLCPGAGSKIYRLWEYTDEPGRLSEIADPIGGSFEGYLACRDDLEECLHNWCRHEIEQRIG